MSERLLVAWNGNEVVFPWQFSPDKKPVLKRL